MTLLTHRGVVCRGIYIALQSLSISEKGQLGLKMQPNQSPTVITSQLVTCQVHI